MKPVTNDGTRQLHLQWEVGESQVWESFEPKRKQEIVELLAELWVLFLDSSEARSGNSLIAAYLEHKTL